MARKKRIEKIGFYHIVNRGVERRTIFCDDEDFKKFLEIVQDSAIIYNFALHSFCLMNNHYHLLLQTKDLNLSLLMRQINSRYSIYFNNKYKRVGPLWQGRFKSWFVYDESYLKALVKYIEYNPIKADITKKIGEYKLAMSSGNFECFSKRVQSTRILNYELIESTKFDTKLDYNEVKKIDELYCAQLEIKK
jgi:REP element-mobilizing transposase RayT